MSLQKTIFISFGLGTALTLVGCGAKDTNPNAGMAGMSGLGGAAGMVTGAGGTTAPPGGGGTTAMAGAAPMAGTTGASGSAGMTTAMLGGDCKSLDFAAYASQPPVSFVNDVLPVFGAACVTSDCHNSAENIPRAELQLGHKCTYDMAAKYKCTFPAAPMDPNDLITQPAPDDPATIMAVYQNLVNKPAATLSGTSMMMRVKPMDPANSFLVLKLADLQNSRGLMCTNTDSSHESNPQPCGAYMPQTGDPLCSGSSRYKFDAVVTWIAQGAMMN